MRNVATQLHANVSVTINVELFNQKSMIYKYGLIYIKGIMLENLVGPKEEKIGLRCNYRIRYNPGYMMSRICPS